MSNAIVLSPDQERAFNLLLGPKNVFLTGKAGTGKSFLINKYLSENEDKKNILITASTGIAACAIKGVTVHSCFKIPIRPLEVSDSCRSDKLAKILSKAEVLFIDEVSMLRVDVFQFVANTIRGYPLKVICVGDFLQLEPVIMPNEIQAIQQLWGPKYISPFAFDAPGWKKLNFEVAELTTIHRQQENEREFITALHNIREGEKLKESIDYINSKASFVSRNNVPADTTVLCPKNRDADAINTVRYKAIKSKEFVYNAEVTGKVSKCMPSPETLYLKKNARVIATANNFEAGYQNGSTGYVMDLNEESVIVAFDHGCVATIGKNEWTNEDYTVTYTKDNQAKLEKTTIGTYKQIPLKLAWAITIHKSQGQTLNQVLILPDSFTNGQLYVALSRLSSYNGLYLEKAIELSEIFTSERALAFYGKRRDDLPLLSLAAKTPKKNEYTIILSDELYTFVESQSEKYVKSKTPDNERITKTILALIEEARKNSEAISLRQDEDEFTLMESINQDSGYETHSIPHSSFSGIRAVLRKVK